MKSPSSHRPRKWHTEDVQVTYTCMERTYWQIWRYAFINGQTLNLPHHVQIVPETLLKSVIANAFHSVDSTEARENLRLRNMCIHSPRSVQIFLAMVMRPRPVAPR